MQPEGSDIQLVLSAFDRSPPERVLALAPELERLGYHRFWMSEHRATPASPNPTLLAAIAASITAKLRVGTAGVMLRYNSPVKVAEDFQLLESIFPGRIDLGTIAGREQDISLHNALLDGRSDDPESYDKRLQHLMDLISNPLTASTSVDSPSGPHAPTSTPQVWICSLTAPSAALAAQRGAGFAYHLYLGRQFSKTDGPELSQLYRSSFQPMLQFQRPAVAVVCFGCCAEKPGAAADIWRRKFSLPPDKCIDVGIPRSGPDFLGTPTECMTQLTAIAIQFGTAELVIHCVNEDVGSQLRQYELLADACRLRERHSSS